MLQLLKKDFDVWKRSNCFQRILMYENAAIILKGF